MLDNNITPEKRSVGTIIKTTLSVNRSTTNDSYTGLSETLVVPAGTYEIYFYAKPLQITIPSSVNSHGAQATLSTDASTETNPELTLSISTRDAATSGNEKVRSVNTSCSSIVTLASETTFTLMGKYSGSASATMLIGAESVLRARKLSSATS